VIGWTNFSLLRSGATAICDIELIVFALHVECSNWRVGESIIHTYTYIHKNYLKWLNVKKLLNYCRRRLLGLRRGKNAEINMSLGG